VSSRDAVLSLLQEQDPHAAERYALCGVEGHGSYSECPRHPIGSESPHPSTYHPYSCMLRLCPRCARQLAADLRRKYGAVLREILAEQSHKLRRGWSLKLITLTTSHEVGSCVGAHVKDTLDAARDVLHTVFDGAEGWGAVAGLEAGEQGAKLHVHALVWSPYVAQERLSEEWRRRTGFRVVDVRSAGGKTTWQDAKSRGYYTERELGGIVFEALKYAVKLTELSPEQLVDFHVALKGRRRVRSWGSFYNSGVVVEREPELCEVCGERMVVTPEWVIDARLKWLERGDRSGLQFITANKSGGRSPPEGPAPAPRRLAGGGLCSQVPAESWERYGETVGGSR